MKMSRLSDLLRQARQANPQLGADLEKEVSALLKRRTFGLVFERHQPEAVELPGRPIRRGDKVRVLPPRGEVKPGDQRLWRVERIERADGARVTHLREIDVEEPETQTVLLDDLVVVAEFKDRIYPGLVETGRVEKGGTTDPFHVVVNAENFHALGMLTYTHRESVDMIFIDPPYNTGGKYSWLYNDDFVDSDDDYRHSKWLAFMERRLRLARELLKPTGVIMISIGEDEQHRLRLLMEQVFGASNFVAQLAVEMSTTSGPKTTNAQQGTIVKNLEYVLLFRKSEAFDSEVRHTPLYDGVERWDAHYSLWLSEDGSTSNLYDHLDSSPVLRDEIERLQLVETKGKRRGRFVGARGMDILLLASPTVKQYVDQNLERIGRMDTPPVSAAHVDVEANRWVVHSTASRTYKITRTGNGTLQQIYTLDRNYRMSDDYEPRFGRTVIRGDLWRGFYGDMGNVSKEGGVAFGNGKKPVRLMAQLFKWANNRSDAVILDFFGGSGSTAHAVAAMNQRDGGCRRSILITNNELSKARRLVAERRGHRPGDPEWECQGVFETATRPRMENISNALSANVAFFALTYEAPLSIRHHRAFERVAPLLWMRAGSQGRIITGLGEDGWDVSEVYAVVENLDQLSDFVRIVEGRDDVRTAFVVTDDDAAFQIAVRDLPDRVTTVRLYSSYLENFALHVGGDV